MNRKYYNDILSQPKRLIPQDIEGLNQIIETFPYLQSAHALRLKLLKNSESFGYNQALKLTAAVTTDRDVLFDYITSEDFLQQTVSETVIGHQEYVKTIEVDFSSQKPLDGDRFSAQLDSTAPFTFDQNERHSFEQWLKLTSAKVIDREKEISGVDAESNEIIAGKNINKWEKIDQFLAQKTIIKPMTNISESNRAEEFLNPREELMTETLARVYKQQKNYEKAIEAYKVLILKYPKKSSFFADQIRDLKRLSNSDI